MQDRREGERVAWVCPHGSSCVHKCAPVEHHSERLRRLVDTFDSYLATWNLDPADAVWVCEGVASRVRREAEERKRAQRGGGK